MKITNVSDLLQMLKYGTGKFYVGWLGDAIAALEKLEADKVPDGYELYLLPKIGGDSYMPNPKDCKPMDANFIDGFKLGHLKASERAKIKTHAKREHVA